MRVLLIDGLNLIRRVYAGAQSAAGENDVPDAGFVRSIAASVGRALRDHHPTHAILVMDGAGQSWRHALFPEYKANRSPMPDALADALPEVEAAVADAGVRALRQDGLEADDLIASIATRLAARDVPVTVLSTDKSMLALTGAGVQVFNHFEKRELDAAHVQERFGVRPEQLPEFLALAGDATQNVPGAPGIGAKSAQALLREHDNLEHILAASETLPTRQRNAIDAARDVLALYRQISTLRTDVSLGLNLSDFRVSES